MTNEDQPTFSVPCSQCRRECFINIQLYGLLLTFPSQWAGTRVVGEGLQGAGAAVGAGAVVAGVVRDRELAEGGRVADGAGALEGRAPVSRHDDVAGAAILALEASGVAGVLVLAVLADEVVWAAGKDNDVLN